MHDPLMRFLWVTGPKNAARITRIKIEGHLHICFGVEDNHRPAGLSRIMQIYTPILKLAFTSLRSLTLHMGYDKECISMDKQVYELDNNSFPLTVADDVPGDRGKSDEEKLDRVVGRVVRELKGLKHLQLGDYKDEKIPSMDVKWGKVVRWMEVVRQGKQDEMVDAAYDEQEMRPGGRAYRHSGQRGRANGNWRGRGNRRGRGNGRGRRGVNSA
jgi:hypothetical protein